MGGQRKILQGQRIAFGFGIGGAAVVSAVGVFALGSGTALSLARLVRGFATASLTGVGEAAGLGALAAVSASASHYGGEEALSRVADAESPVNEDLYLQRIACHSVRQIRKTGLTGNDEAGKAPIRQDAADGGVVSRELGAGVEGERGKGSMNEGGGSHVGDDEGIHAAGGGLVGGLQGVRQLPIPKEGIEGQIDTASHAVSVGDGLFELSGIEIVGIETGIEAATAQIDRIGSRQKGGLQRLG